MNALYVINKYLDIKAGNIPATPLTVFSSLEGCTSLYNRAEDVIHLILTLSQVVPMIQK